MAMKDRGFGFKALKFVNETIDAIVYAGGIVFLVIRPFVLQTFFIPSGSMLNTLQLQDFIVGNKAIYRYSEPAMGDIVVFRPPTRALMPGQGDSYFIKRLIATAGVTPEIRNGKLYRNGVLVDEKYVTTGDAMNDFKLVKDGDQIIPVNRSRDTSTVNGYWAIDGKGAPMVANEYMVNSQDIDRQEQLWALPAQPVPAGYFLMMGDNRNGSFDGRGWGLVPRRDIIAKSEFIWLPFNRIGSTR
jgi:signal peptidase I